MRDKKAWLAMGGILATLAMTLVLPIRTEATSKFKLLTVFYNKQEGEFPDAALVFDKAGSLYTTTYGGGSGGGTVIELSPTQDGKWSKKILYEFTGHKDGGNPLSGLIFDQAGNLYGTTVEGGDLSGCNGVGCGVVFKLTPKGGNWIESVLHSFAGGKDGAQPYAGLVFDAAGNLYGTTTTGGGLGNCNGGFGCGVVFELSPNRNGGWTEKVLHRFTGGKDGASPWDVPNIDGAGNVYGTTLYGGNFNSGCNVSGCGVVFRLSPNQSGDWTEKVLHTFTGAKDGGYPRAGLIFDAGGNLYGATSYGGNLSHCHPSGCGVVFRLSANESGEWSEKVLHEFTGEDGEAPDASLTFDAAGSLYGPTAFGGNVNYCKPYGCGVVFELTSNARGSWTESVPHRFGGTGNNPEGSLIFDESGNLYGTGGCESRCKGVVFEISP
jgi:uncharacterized repeat protein (TIGR03803 family)